MGKSSEEANENAASQYLDAIFIGTHDAIVNSRKPLKDVAPNSSFIRLNNMYSGLRYQTIIDRDENNVHKVVVQVNTVTFL